MIVQRPRFATGGLVVALLLLAAPRDAAADTVENGTTHDTLFLVFANSGQFGTFSAHGNHEHDYEDYENYEAYEGCEGCGEEGGSGQAYTVINFAQFLSGLPFPGAIPAIGATITGQQLFEATGGLFGSFGDFAGYEFFFIGSYLASEHLMYGSDSPDGPLVPEDVQGASIPGLMRMGDLDPALAGLGGIAVVGDAAFWAQMGLTPEQVNQLLGAGVLASASAGGAGENVFGFSDPTFIGISGYRVGQDGGLTGEWAPVPEPGTYALVLVVGLVGTWNRARRRRRAA